MLANGIALNCLSSSAMLSQAGEKGASVATIYNLSTDPSCVVALTKTRNVVASLTHVAYDPNAPSDIRLAASDALANLGFCGQALAGAGTVSSDAEDIFLPTFDTSGWKRWN
jgi:hypothetical protein